MVERLSGDDGDVVANGDLGQTLLGFHGIEFILFRDGQPRKASELNANGHDSWNRNGLDFTQLSGDYELTFAKAVAGDLRNSVYRLECCWNKVCRKAPAKLTRSVCLTASTVLVLGILYAVVFMMIPSLRESGEEFVQKHSALCGGNRAVVDRRCPVCRKI